MIDGAIATRGQRVLGSLVDLLLVGGPLGIGVWLTSEVDISKHVFRTPSLIVWSAWIVRLVYEIGLTAWTGQTIGKRIAHTRVVLADSLATPTIPAAVARAFPVAISRIPVVGQLVVLVYLPILWRSDRKGLHDFAAKTIVISSDF